MDLGLGFNMKLLILITALFVIATQTSCIEKQNLEDSSLGPAVDAAIIEKSMAESVGVLDLYDAKKNELNALALSTTLENTQNYKIYNQILLVDSIVDTANTYTINLNFTKQDLQDSNSSFSDIRYPLVIDKNSSLDSFYNQNEKLIQAVTKKDGDEQQHPAFLIAEYADNAKNACKRKNVTCHSFKNTKYEITLPAVLAHPSICENLDTCTILVSRIEYDLIDGNKLDANGKGHRISFSFVVSKKLPLFSKVMSFCYRQLVEFGNRKVLAESCYDLTNFSAGGSAQ